jgi:GNAT superfamily N-acetyltransferase
VELLARAAVVGEKQEADGDLGYEKRLRKREQVCRDITGPAPSPVEVAARQRRDRAYRDRRRPQPRMDLRHAARVAKRAHVLRERIRSTRVDAGRTGTPDLAIVPANEATCDDLQAVFGTRGAAAYCQCQRYKLRPREAFAKFPVEERARRLREQTRCGHPGSETTSGLVAYADGEPVGWCAVEPRTAYTGLLRNNRVPWEGREEDTADNSVWAVTCVFTRAGFRGHGTAHALARASVDAARSLGARSIESYPMVTTPGQRMSWDEIHVGSRSIFAAAGFEEVSHPTLRRVVMRIDF